MSFIPKLSQRVATSAPVILPTSTLARSAAATQIPRAAARQFQPLTAPTQRALLHHSAPTQQQLCYGSFINRILKTHHDLHGKPNVYGLDHLHQTIRTGEPAIISAFPHVADPGDTIEIAIASNLDETHHIQLPMNIIAQMEKGVDEALALFNQTFSQYAAARLDLNRARKNTSKDTETVEKKAQALVDALEKEFATIHDRRADIRAMYDEWISAAAEDRLPNYMNISAHNRDRKKHLTVVAREEMKKNPVLGPILNAAKAVYTPRATEGAMGKIEAELKNQLTRAVPIIYSEGARGNAQQIYRPRPGTSILAQRNDIHLLPVVLQNISHSWMRGAITRLTKRLTNRHAPVTVIFLPPLPKIGTTADRMPAMVIDEVKQHTAAHITGKPASAHFLHRDGHSKPATGLPPLARK